MQLPQAHETSETISTIFSTKQRGTSLPIKDNVPLELLTSDHKKIIIEYSSETKQLVIKAGANTLKSTLVN